MSTYVPIDYVRDTIDYFHDHKGNVYPNSSVVYDYVSSKESLIELMYTCDMSKSLGSPVAMSEDYDVLRDYLVSKIDVGVREFADNKTLHYYITACDITSKWRKNKVVYKVDAELSKQFYNMQLPDDIRTHVFTKQPAECYYIDMAGNGDTIMSNLHGIFVRTKMIDEFCFLQFILIPNNKDDEVICKAMYVDSLSDTVPNLSKENNGFDRLNETALYNFFLNFSTYLNAANRDVEVSVRTRDNHARTFSVIKDKFREVKEFDVGLRYGNTVRDHVKRYKYIGDKSPNTADKRSITSHYRRAHWHHYWVGSGEDKKLIIKWVDSVFVKGNKETDAVVVHKVK